MSERKWPEKSRYRCTVCNDIHFGTVAPKTCPTCGYKDAYVKVPSIEAETVEGIVTDLEEIKRIARQTPKQQLTDLFDRFVQGQEFELNPDAGFLSLVLDGVLTNEKNTGLKYCPCRLQSDDMSYNITLLCPCDFTNQDVYKEQGRCWCGLFTKRQ